MSTANYQTQDNFDLWVFDEDNYLKEQKQYYVEDFEIEEEELSLYDFILDNYYNWFDVDFKEVENQLKYLDKRYRDLEFFEISYESGYYSGVQLLVKPKNNRDYYNIYNHDNEDFQYEFGECKSAILRRFTAEIKRINKHILPYYAKNLYMCKLGIVGRFSNGEVVDERIGE